MTGSIPKISVKGFADSCVRCSGEQTRADERPVETVHVLGGLTRHPVSVSAQPEARKATVEHTAGVVDLSVAHEMKAIGGHPDSLRGGFYEVAERARPHLPVAPASPSPSKQEI